MLRYQPHRRAGLGPLFVCLQGPHQKSDAPVPRSRPRGRDASKQTASTTESRSVWCSHFWSPQEHNHQVRPMFFNVFFLVILGKQLIYISGIRILQPTFVFSASMCLENSLVQSTNQRCEADAC
jgi:hypothetical protein